MCTIYSLNQCATAVVAATGVTADRSGGVSPLPAVHPGTVAPVVHAGTAERTLAPARWGLPSPAVVVRGRGADPGTTCIRNLRSLHWSRWLAVEYRCVVPFSSFALEERLADGSRQRVWLALDATRPLAWFAGIRTTWASPERLREREVNCDQFAVVASAPSADLAALEVQSMPVILRNRSEVDLWLSAPTSTALALQRPLPDGALAVVARGARQDAA